MSKTVSITSPAQFSQLSSSSKIVVVDFYADWCGPCKMIAPVYEQLSQQLTRPGNITFTRVDVDSQQQIARSFNITAMPTFLILRNSRETIRIQGANPQKLQEAVKKLAAEAESLDSSSGASGSSSSNPLSSSSNGQWLGTALPRGYSDVTDQVDVRGLELLNFDAEAGGARTLFESSPPSALATSSKSGKGKAPASGTDSKGKKDWVESDTDEQLMLFIPFMATLKIHTLLITSLPTSSDGDDDAPMRPKTIRLFTNHPHNLGFEEASDATPTQEITLTEKDWDQATGTARVELRFVKFQKCSSLVVFVVDGEGDGETVRVDRIRVVGESGVKREMGKLEKVGDEQGE